MIPHHKCCKNIPFLAVETCSTKTILLKMVYFFSTHRRQLTEIPTTCTYGNIQHNIYYFVGILPTCPKFMNEQTKFANSLPRHIMNWLTNVLVLLALHVQIYSYCSILTVLWLGWRLNFGLKRPEASLSMHRVFAKYKPPKCVATFISSAVI